MMQFAALHESLDGTFRTCRPDVTMSVPARRPEVGGHFQNSAPVEWRLGLVSNICLLARRRAHSGNRNHFYAHFLKIHAGG
jgi:hypothetical protein